MFIAYNFSHLTYPPGKGIKFRFGNTLFFRCSTLARKSSSFEVQLIHLSYCKISYYIHLVTVVTVTAVTKVNYVCVNG